MNLIYNPSIKQFRWHASKDVLYLIQASTAVWGGENYHCALLITSQDSKYNPIFSVNTFTEALDFCRAHWEQNKDKINGLE